MKYLSSTLNRSEFDLLLLEDIVDNRQTVDRLRGIAHFECHTLVTRSYPRNHVTSRWAFFRIIPRAYCGRGTSRCHIVAAVVWTQNSCSMIQHQCRLVFATVRFMWVRFLDLINYSCHWAFIINSSIVWTMWWNI